MRAMGMHIFVLAALAALAAWLCLVAYRGDATPARRTQVVVARYAEDLSWLDVLPCRDVVVYDKNDRGDTSHGNPPAWAEVKRLPNVGREGHTYLHHILTNWDSLADVTLFVPGSAAEMGFKWAALKAVVSQACRTGDTTFPVSDMFSRPLHEHLAGFTMESYASTATSNSQANPSDTMLPSPHRPFGVFYANNFPPLPIREEVTKGVFAVSREHIRQHPKQRYERLLRYVDSHSNPEAGHFLERSWNVLFYPFPRSCYVHPPSPDEPGGAFVALAAVAAAVAVAAALVSKKISLPYGR